MLSKTAIHRITGVLLLAFLAAIIVAASTSAGIDTYEEDFHESIQEVVDNNGRFWTSTAFLGLSSVLAVALGAVMYVTFSPHERTLALLGAFGFLLVGAALMVGTFTAEALGDLASDYKRTHGPSPEIIAIAARPLSNMAENMMFSGIAALPALGMLAFGALIVWSRAVPRWLGWLAIASGILAPVVFAFWLIGIIGVMLGMIWLFLMGWWLILRGTKEVAAAEVS